MSERRTIYHDAFGVRRTLIESDDVRQKFTIHTQQDVEPILDGIARDRELMRPRGDNKLAARLPLIVYEDLVLRGIADDEDAFKDWLNSPEAGPFRIWQGRL